LPAVFGPLEGGDVRDGHPAAISGDRFERRIGPDARRGQVLPKKAVPVPRFFRSLASQTLFPAPGRGRFGFPRKGPGKRAGWLVGGHGKPRPGRPVG